MNQQLEAIAPVMFESGEYYFGFGTSLLVKYGDDAFWVTARHVVEKQNQDIYAVRIFPSDSAFSLSFDLVLDIEENEDDPDFSDLFIAKVEKESYFEVGGDGFLAHELLVGCVNPNQLLRDSLLVVVGYPGSGRSYDYEKFKIKKTLKDYTVRYNGKSEGMANCYSVLFDSVYSEDEYNGLSGSPVYVKNDGALYLVGIMIRASADRGHFIDVGVLRSAIVKSVEVVT